MKKQNCRNNNPCTDRVATARHNRIFVGMICDGAGGNGLVYVVYCGIVSLVLLGLYLLCCAGFYFLWKVSFCNNRIIRFCFCIFAALAVGLLLLL